MRRLFSTAIRYSTAGKPGAVLKQEALGPVAKAGVDEVSIRFLAAPINPSDLNMVEGV